MSDPTIHNPPPQQPSPELPAPTQQPPTTTPCLNLLVKNPTDRPGSEPFNIQVEPSCTVADLKNYLSSSYPGSPPVSAQRLIYAGKLLDNNTALDSLMTSSDPSVQHTVHLVVSHHSRFHPSSAAAASSSSQPSQQQSPIHGGSAPANARPQQAAPNAPLHGFPQTAPFPYIPPIAQYPPAMDPRYFYPGMPHPSQPPSAAYPNPYLQSYAPYPPPPSDNNTNTNPNSNNPASAPEHMPYMPLDPSAYAAHLQAMERMIADTLAAHQQSAQGAAAAQAANAQATAAAQAANAQAAAVAQAAEGEAQAAAAAMHAHHMHVMANMNQGLRAQMENAQGAAPIVPPFAPPLGAQNGVGFGFGGVGANGVPEGGAHLRPNVQGGEGAPRVRQFVFQFEINWSLISKLIFLVFLLGQEGSPRRVYTLMIVAVLIYLWQTNWLGFVRRLAGGAVPDPTQLFEILFPQEDRQQEGTDGGANDQGERRRVQSRLPNRFGRVALFVSFLYSFIYGFFCSLLPGWRPRPLPRLEEVRNNQGDRIAGGNQNEIAAGENQVEAENDHEHAD